MDTIQQVQTQSQLKTFIDFPKRLYRNNKYHTFYPKNYYQKLFSQQNPFWKRIRYNSYILLRNASVIGRIVYFYDKVLQMSYFGYFETINDISAAKRLVETVKEQARTDGNKILYGPINLSFMHEVGFVKDRFNAIPEIGFIQSKKYYLELFKKMGFSIKKELYSYRIPVHDIKTKPKTPYTLRSVNLKEKEKEIRRIHMLFDTVFLSKQLWPYRHFTLNEYKFVMKDILDIIDPHLIKVVEDKKKLIGCAIVLPNYNELLIALKQKKAISKLFAYLNYKKYIDRYRLEAIAIDPAYQHHHIGTVMLEEILNYLCEKNARYLDYSWVDQENRDSQALAKHFKGKLYQTHVLLQK